METSLSISDFNALVRDHSDPLAETLRQIMALEGPEDVQALQAAVPNAGWTGWSL